MTSRTPLLMWLLLLSHSAAAAETAPYRLSLQRRLRGGADPQYHTPANPFATPGAGATRAGGTPIPPPPTSGKPFVPPPPTEPQGALPRDDVDSGAGGLLGGIAPEPALAPAAEQPLPMPSDANGPEASGGSASFAAAKAAPRKGGMRWRSTACLAVLSAACVFTRPHETSLVTALDAHREEFGHLVEDTLGLEDAGVDVLNLGLGSAAVHGDLVWLGMLGRWLPLLPASADAIDLWMASIGAEQLLMLALSAGYLVRKVVPSLFATSFRAVLGGKVHTLATSSVAPAGLVHWMHALVVLLVASSGLADVVGGRKQLLGWWVASGAASAVSCVLTQMVFGRRAQLRSSVSGAAMGLLLLRAAAAPTDPIDVGGALSLSPLRCVLIHLLLDHFSNALPPPGARGVEKLLAHFGVAVLVAAVRPQARELVAGALEGAAESGWDWKQMLGYVRAAL